MTAESKPRSLQEFAANDRHDVPWLARQGIWPAVVDGYHEGIRVTTIRQWLLRECGFADKALPSAERLQRYLRANHPKDDE